MKHSMGLDMLVKTTIYDKEGLSTLDVTFMKDTSGSYYGDIGVVDGARMLNKLVKLDAKDYKSAFKEWNRECYLTTIPQHLYEYYGILAPEIQKIIVEFTELENNKPKKYQVKNYLGEISEFSVKVFYKD